MINILNIIAGGCLIIFVLAVIGVGLCLYLERVRLRKEFNKWHRDYMSKQINKGD